MSTSLSWQRRLYPLLYPFGRAYSGLMRVRRFLYEGDYCKRFLPRVPCVSVGNIGWGGSGKTPLVSWLLSWAEENGLETVVLTRGYKGKPREYPYPVTPKSSPRDSGDEPLMLARKHPRARIVVDPQRMRSGVWAVKQFTPRLILLDDGFQHQAAIRHADLVLLHPEDLQDGWNRVFPAGSWREGKSALSRASAFFIKAAPGDYIRLKPFISKHLAEFGKPVFSFSLQPMALARVKDGDPVSPSDLRGYVLATGVGDPGQVLATAGGYLGREPKDHVIFKDHHAYTEQDWDLLCVQAKAANASHIVCTAKDAVKLSRFADERLLCLEVAPRFGPRHYSDVPFPDWWEGLWKDLNSGKWTSRT